MLHHRLLCGWFCPYAQRAWIALNQAGIPYTYVEALIIKQDESYHKTPELLKHNPKGLVPTLVPVNHSTSEEGLGSVIESLVCIEYIDDVVRNHNHTQNQTVTNTSISEYKQLLPDISNPLARAKCRIKTDWVNRELCSPFYTVLVRKEHNLRRSAYDKIVRNLKIFSRDLGETPGPYYFGNEVSMTDIALIPWAYRYPLLEHFRGSEFRIPDRDDPDSELSNFWTWRERMLLLPSVKSTLQDMDKLVTVYERYSRGDAKSKVGDAVRQGLQAHDIE
uniref:Glutathione transferase n=1 Tax=Aplanochytrium stocchinoi TaxID=215587 RepID=A0A7S3LGP4_9STRA|mmetsp:Transcript_17653/g.21442  ORF Transcript_17653/g.21442 Transcript_17653/m.21442 type:complete len:277 (-) Transcript_17653:1136-1966(-)